jgi:hypothetical protein
VGWGRGHVESGAQGPGWQVRSGGGGRAQRGAAAAQSRRQGTPLQPFPC